MGKKAKPAQPRGGLGACSPRKFLNLGSQECHFQHFSQDIFSKLVHRKMQKSVVILLISGVVGKVQCLWEKRSVTSSES